MTVSLITTKSCCSSKSLIAEIEKGIRKSSINAFKEAGYFAPDNFLNAGIFYVHKGSMTVTASFGATKLSIRCAGASCDEQVAEFIFILNTLDQAEMVK